MNTVIRKYTQQDFPMIASWYEKSNQPRIWNTLYPEDSSYILELEGKPLVCMCVYYFMNSQICMMENLISNPEYPTNDRKSCVDKLFHFIETEAKSKGYKNMILCAYIDKLKERYSDLGYVKTLDNVCTFSKQL